MMKSDYQLFNAELYKIQNLKYEEDFYNNKNLNFKLPIKFFYERKDIIIDWEFVGKCLREEAQLNKNTVDSRMYYCYLILRLRIKWRLIHDKYYDMNELLYKEYKLHTLYIAMNHHFLENNILSKKGSNPVANKYHFMAYKIAKNDYVKFCKENKFVALSENENILFEWQFKTY